MTDLLEGTEPLLPPPAEGPPGFHLPAKPSGSTCNIDCTYCFFLSKEALRHLLCIHAPTCGYGPALESNGDLYSCDHFVEPKFLLGNIHKTHMLTLVSSAEQRKFGNDKRDTLTAQCQEREVRPLCNGGCPKDRFAVSRDGEPGQNYLCAGLELFFKHTAPTMRAMAQLIEQRRYPAEVMTLVAAEDKKRGPYQPCPCGSGLKFRFCHGTSKPRSQFNGVSPTNAGRPGSSRGGLAPLLTER
jgi:uncharacterized protein